MKYINFKKGDYVVLLASCKGDNIWNDSLPINYIYKLREDMHEKNFMVERDRKGNRDNGWSVVAENYESQLDARLAFPAEIEAYEMAKGPIPSHKTISYEIF